jgi:hypothetical protein
MGGGRFVTLSSSCWRSERIEKKNVGEKLRENGETMER